MSAVHALTAARAVGVRLGIDGEALTLEADAAPPPGVIDLPARHKIGVMALLRTGATAGRAKTGAHSSMNGRASRSSTAGCRENRPKPAPLPAASPNGSTAIRYVRR